MLIRRLPKSIIEDLPSRSRGCGESAIVDLAPGVIVALLAVLILGFPSRCLAENHSPADVCGDQLIFSKIDSLVRKNDLSVAMETLHEVSSCHNLTPLGKFRLGWLYVETGDFESALNQFQQVGGDVPSEQGHAYAMAFVEFHLGKFNAAMRSLLPFQRSNSLDQDSANLLGVVYAKSGDYQNAYSVFRNEISRNPHDLLAYLNMITLLSDAGKFSEAADLAREASKLFPQKSRLRIVDGAANVLLGKEQQAREEFLSAVQMEPRNPDARFLLAVTSYKMGKYRSAKRELEESLQAGVASSDLYYLLARCDIKLGSESSSAALAAANQAVQLNHESVQALTLKGKLLLTRNQPKVALVSLSKAYRLNPNSHDAIYNLARCYSALGEREKAAVLFHKLSTQIEHTVVRLSNDRAKLILQNAAASH